MLAPAHRRALRASALALACAFSSAPAVAETTAFYYGPAVPPELWQAYDQVVVEPEHVPSPGSVAPRRAEPVAYVSLGEVSRQSPEAARISPGWVLGDNKNWSSWVLDVAHPDYQSYLLARCDALFAQGYQRFFLDTLDSYRLVAREPLQLERQRKALVELVRALVRRHPNAKILLNRGFELLAELGPIVHGVVAESLFDRWDAAQQRYARVPEADRAWLLARLREVQHDHRLPVTVIDYRPPGERALARETARRIAELGFEPWVTDAALRGVGVGRGEIMPRRVLVLTDDAQPASPDAEPPSALGPLPPSPAQRWLAPVLEHLGYVPEPRQVWREPLETNLAGRYAGIVTWFSSGRVVPGYAEWLRAQLALGVRVAVLGAPGFDLGGETGRALGARVLGPASASGVRPLERDALIGFEAEPPARPLEAPRLRFEGPGVVNHLTLVDGRGEASAAVVTAGWGGAALSHVLATRGLGGERAWVIDPFAFLTRALGLPELPQPDVTTENGRRVALWLVRSQGLARATRLRGRPSTQAVLERLWRERRWPHGLALSAEFGQAASAEELAAVDALDRLGFVERVQLAPGSTDARAERPSLTHVQGMLAGAEAVAPIAGDFSFLPPNSHESYPYARVRQTLAFTDAPRRLKPILLDYHASLVQSPGGAALLSQLYHWLDGEQVFPLRVSDYVERVRAFREQVLVRNLDGSFQIYGGDALRTLRMPVALGYPDLAASRAVASWRRLPQGQYVTFLPGRERRLLLGPVAPLAPHVVQSSGSIEQFALESAGETLLGLRLEVRAAGPLELEIAGLPPGARCSLTAPPLRAVVDARGHLFLRSTVSSSSPAAGAPGLLRCRLAKERS